MDVPTLPLTLTSLKKSPLSKADKSLLVKLEKQVELSWFECSTALARIRLHGDGRLWRDQGYKTFNEYVYSRFNYSPQHALRQVAAGEFLLSLEDTKSRTPRPERESQIRPIVQKLPADHQVPCWEIICEKHDGADITAQIIEAEVTEYKKTIPKEELIGTRKAEKTKKAKPSAVERARERSLNFVKKLKKASEPLPRHKEIAVLLKNAASLINRRM